MDNTVKIAAIIICASSAGMLWFLAASAALSRLSLGKMRKLEEKDKKTARRMEAWIERRETYETSLALLVGVAALSLMGASIVLIHALAPKDFSIVKTTLIASVLTLAISILALPAARILAAIYDIPALRSAIPIAVAMEKSILMPATLLSYLIDKLLGRWLPEGDDVVVATTEDEILSLMEQDEIEGDNSAALEEDEKRMIKGVFELDRTRVREIMTPRVDLDAIPAKVSLDDAITAFLETGHSRIPIYDDNVDNIKGILYAKDLLDKKRGDDNSLQKIARKPIYIPETKDVGDLLEEFRKSRNHFAVVIDEYGGTAGIVTLEDILEEIVGEIRDEYDVEENDAPTYVLLDGKNAIFEARTPTDEVNEVLNAHIPDNDEVDTIGGVVCGALGRIPKPGEKVTIADGELEVEVLQADKKRVLKLKISRLDKPKEAE